MGLALLWLTRLDTTSDYATDILVPIILLGASAGAVVVPLNLIVRSAARSGSRCSSPCSHGDTTSPMASPTPSPAASPSPR